MKKIIAMAVAAAGMTVFSACGSDKPDTNADTWNYKTGLATYTHTNDTYGWSEDRNGQSAVSTTVVAAVFDKDGKIVKINIDEVESKTGFDATGQLTNYTGEEIVSKKEMGEDYGMRAASSIGKEWYQQIETLEKWLEGKDVKTVFTSANQTVKGIMDASSGSADSEITRNADGSVSGTVPDTSVTDGTAGGDIMDGVNSAINDMTDGGENFTGTTADVWMDEDLKAGVTIDTTYIQRTIEKAYRNAK